MAKTFSTFPISLDTTLSSDRQSGDLITSDSYDIIETALSAIEAKMGIDSSADADSLDYKTTWVKGTSGLSAITISATAISAITYHGLPTISKGGTILSAAATADIVAWRAPFDCTVLGVYGYRTTGGSAEVNARLSGAFDLLSASLALTSASTWLTGAGLQNTAMSAGEKLELQIKSISGTPAELAVQVDFSIP